MGAALECRSDRRRKHRASARPQQRSGLDVAGSRLRVGQADTHVDGNPRDVVAGDEIEQPAQIGLDPNRRDLQRICPGRRDHPASAAPIDACHERPIR